LNFDAIFVLYRAGRPTSVVLLLLMIVAQFTLPLSRHPPLGLHHLLRLVGSSRSLVTLSGIEILQIGTRMTTSSGFRELRGVTRTVVSRRNATIYSSISKTMPIKVKRGLKCARVERSVVLRE
jgi:hypothetical protein